MQKKTCKQCGCYHKNYLGKRIAGGMLYDLCFNCEVISGIANRALFEIKQFAKTKGRSLTAKLTIRKIIKKSK